MPLKKISEFLAASIWLFSTNQYGVSGKNIIVMIKMAQLAAPHAAAILQELKYPMIQSKNTPAKSIKYYSCQQKT